MISSRSIHSRRRGTCVSISCCCSRLSIFERGGLDAPFQAGMGPQPVRASRNRRLPAVAAQAAQAALLQGKTGDLRKPGPGFSWAANTAQCRYLGTCWGAKRTLGPGLGVHVPCKDKHVVPPWACHSFFCHSFIPFRPFHRRKLSPCNSRGPTSFSNSFILWESDSSVFPSA